MIVPGGMTIDLVLLSKYVCYGLEIFWNFFKLNNYSFDIECIHLISCSKESHTCWCQVRDVA